MSADPGGRSGQGRVASAPSRADARNGRDAITPATLRGVYLWAGGATALLNRVKFPDSEVDDGAHRDAHTAEAARALANCGLNLAFLAMNWGFPPEVEKTHWDEFRDAARRYHDHGFHVIGYVQASNCLAEGSHAAKDWYVRTPEGRTVAYYRNRLMTCWNHPEWVDAVAARARGVIEAGGDGVFFDNLWMGATPWLLGGVTGGFAGCACERCDAAFTRATGHRVPRRLLIGDDTRERYLAWRSEVVAQRLAGWAAAVRALRPTAWILANNSDVMLRPTGEMFGLEPARLAPIQDAVLVENIAMPRLDATRRQLIGNAIPVRALRSTVPGHCILTVTYEHGIGLDGPPPPASLRRSIAEAAALGACPIVKGTEYLDRNGRFTVLTADALASTRDAIAPILRWLRDNEALFAGVRPDPDVLVLYDTAAFARDFAGAAAATYGVANALLHEGIAFGFVTPAELTGGQTRPPVLLPPGARPPAATTHRFIAVNASDIAPLIGGASISRSAIVQRIADPVLGSLARAYFGTAGIRRAIDRLGITARFLRSAYFDLPGRPGRIRDLLPALRSSPLPGGPALVERWLRDDGVSLVHLVNYADAPIPVILPASWEYLMLHTSDAATRIMTADDPTLHLQLHAVIELPSPRSERQPHRAGFAHAGPTAYSS